jgi:hypothetical protein
MKSFFDRVARSFQSVRDATSGTSSSSSSGSGGVRSSRGPAHVYDPCHPVIVAAAQAVSEIINAIVSDAAGLQENVDGYHRLLLVLESTVMEENPTTGLPVVVGAEGGYVGGSSCFEVLLRYCAHPAFVEKCSETEVAAALLNALRVLRMYEIKQAQHPSGLLIDDPTYAEAYAAHPGRGITHTASARVCKVLGALMGDTRSVELFRPSLLKLLLFPLGALPETARHLHEHSAAVVASLCAAGLTSQLVHFMHDIQVVAHMVQHLADLVADDDGASSSGSGGGGGGGREPRALRGAVAEEAGVWVSAVGCLVDVITATLAVGAVMMDDFEAAGGRALLVRIVERSSPGHVTGNASLHLPPLTHAE